MQRTCADLRRHRGVILTEACAALALMGLVLGLVSVLLTQHARATDYFLNHRRVQLAAESCVEQMRVGVRALAEADFDDEAGIHYEIGVAEAEEAWRPLRHVNVTATFVCKNGRAARYALHSYVGPVNAPQGGGP